MRAPTLRSSHFCRRWARHSPIPNPIASFQSSAHAFRSSTLSAAHVNKRAQRRHQRGRLTSRRPSGIPDRGSICDGWRPKPRHDRRPRVPAHLACARTSPPHRSNCQRWRASEHSSAEAGCSRAFPSRCVLRSVTHCGPTLSRTPTRAKRTPSKVPSPSRFLAAWGPRTAARARTTTRRPDKRESVRDARRAAPGPRAGLGRDVRHVGAGARGSTPARARHADAPRIP